MNHETADEHALRERVERLERTSQWLTALAAVLAILSVSLLAWQFAPIEPMVEARGFSVRDVRWRLIAELRELQDGTPALRMYGRNGHARATLHLNSKGSVALRLNDTLGQRRAELSVNSDGAPSLVMWGTDGQMRATLAVSDTGVAGHQGLVLRNRLGQTVWSTSAPEAAH